ncbi:MAG: YbbR-like domain-containing protein [Bacteroidaceae bacterium]|nr:YbbR-like domain-containing protein [Bacteroidaceae bacterium]
MKRLLRKLFRLTTRTLLKLFSKDVLVFMFFLLLSSLFWLMQQWDDEMTNEVTVPVALTELPDNVHILTPMPTHVRVTVRDIGPSFLRYWWSGIDTMPISFRDYYEDSRGRLNISPSDLRRRLQEHLGQSKVVSFAPDSLVATYNHGEHKHVPVRLRGRHSAASGYQILSARIVPDSVNVYAFASVLDTLKAVWTLPTDTAGLKHSLENFPVTLQRIRGTVMEPARVGLNIEVDAMVDASRQIPIVATNFPAGRVLRTFPSVVTVNYSISSRREEAVRTEDFVLVVTYEDILRLQDQGVTRLPLQLRRTPLGAQNVRITPREVDFLIESLDDTDE